MNKKRALELLRDMIDGARKDDYTKFLMYFPVNDKKVKQVAEEVFNRYKEFNVLLAYDRQDRQKVVCSVCKKAGIITDGYNHKERCKCPHCNRLGIVIHGWRVTEENGAVKSTAYILVYDRADYDHKAVTCQGFKVTRRINRSTGKASYTHECNDYFLFGKDKAEHRQYAPWAYYQYWRRRKQCKVDNNICNYVNVADSEMCSSIAKVLKGSYYEYCDLKTMERFIDFNYVPRLLEEYCKHRQIEYLIKLGLVNIVRSKVVGDKMHNAINWRGRTIKKVLKANLNKDDIAFLQEKNRELDTLKLRWLQVLKDEGIGFRQAYPIVEKLLEVNYYWHLEDIYKYGVKASRMLDYIKKQEALLPDENNNLNLMADWRDYLRDCKELGMDLTDKSVLYPRNLRTAHYNTIVQVKVKTDKKLDDMIKAAWKSRQMFNFAYGGIISKPAGNSGELVAEGGHCIIVLVLMQTDMPRG